MGFCSKKNRRKDNGELQLGVDDHGTFCRFYLDLLDVEMTICVPSISCLLVQKLMLEELCLFLFLFPWKCIP